MGPGKKQEKRLRNARMFSVRLTNYLQFLIFCVASCVTAFTDLNAQEPRVWRTADGKHSVEAALIGQTDDRVKLRRKDGRIVEVAINVLSEQDQIYASEAAERLTQNTQQPVAGDQIDRDMQRLASQHGLATLNGLPVVRAGHFLDPAGANQSDASRRRYQQANEQLANERAALARFIERVVLGADPSYFEDQLPTFIANHLPQNIAATYIQYRFQTGGAVGVWKGADEFQRNASRQAFEQKHAKQLADLAVHSPIRLRFVSQARFSTYDFVRNGMAVAALTKSFEPMTPGTEWADSLPVLPTTGALRKKWNALASPLQGSTFWKVDPSVVQNLPSKTRSFLGRNQIERWAFVGTVVTFQSVPLLGHVAREEPAFFAKVESVGLYAEPTLKTLLHRFDLQSFPDPVLLNESHEVIGEKGQPIPLDELALAGLAANDPTFEVHPEFWGALWGHISKLDEVRYAAINRVVKESFQANHAVANFARLNQEPDEEQRNKAISILAGLQAQGDEMLAPSRRPFFPTYTGRNGRYAHEKVETLSPQQQSCLTNWLVKRNQVAEDRFQILVQVKTNGNTDEPTVIDHPHRPELLEKLQELGAKPDHHYSLNENLAFDQRGRLNKKGTQTDLFRAPGTAYKSLQFLLDFGFPVDTLVRKLPKQIVDNSLALKPDDIPIAIQVEFQVSGLKVFENLIGDRPYVVLKANPQKLIALSDEKTIIFSEALDVSSLNKLAANKPKKAIPTVPSDQSGPHLFTPQLVLPLIGKIAPEFLENELQLDQLMVMRWRLENTGMSGITSDGVRFFKKGSRQLPAFEERKSQAEQFKAWTRRWSETLPEDFAVQYESFQFAGNDKNIRSPAILSGGQPYRWITIDLRISDIIYELNNPERIHPPMPAEEISALSALLSLAPSDVFLDQQYAIPDAKGEISQWPAASNQRIAGIPVANQTEPIFPLLRFDKEIWLPENAELSASTQKPQLEVVLHPETFELLDKPPRHHWIDGYWRYRRTAPQDDRMRDDGKYAIIGVRLKSARLVDPATGKTVLPLVLKDYRIVKERVVAEKAPPSQ